MVLSPTSKKAVNMTNTAVVGLQWGDEGKGRIVDDLSADYDWGVRYNGGPNAGHTVYVGNIKVVLHTVPSGIFRHGVKCVIGNGMVADPAGLYREICKINSLGDYANSGTLSVSEEANIIMPWHQVLDGIEGGKLDTTRRGIGPCYADKTARKGVRFGHLFDRKGDVSRDVFAGRVRELYDEKREVIKTMLRLCPTKDETAYQLQPIDGIIDEIVAAAEQLKDCITVTDTGELLYDAEQRGESMLFEGAQGAMLDIDHGTYPFVTSSLTTTAGIACGVGFVPRIDRVIGVVKAYTTRVGGGPFPTEEENERGGYLRQKGGEYGSTTGRPRRCGWLDLVQLRKAVRLNGPTELALTKLDVLGGISGKIKVCTGYELDGETIDTFPSRLKDLERCKPVYGEEFDLWVADISGARNFRDLPKSAQSYVLFVEEELGVPITYVSVGPKAEQKILMHRP